MCNLRLLSLAVAFTVAAVPSAVAGVVLVETQTRLGGGGAATTTQVFIEGNRIRIETPDVRGQNVVIFDGDREILWLVDDGKQSYHEITKADLDRLGAQLGDAMAQMAEQLKNVPPEQRAMIESMMKGKMGGLGGAAMMEQTVYTKVASGETVNQWTADRYEGRRGAEKRWDIWTVGATDLGLAVTDFSVLMKLGGFFQGLAQTLGDNLFRVGSSQSSPDLYDGIPVRRISYANGQPDTQYEVTEVRRESLDASLFSVPAGFEKESFPGMPQR